MIRRYQQFLTKRLQLVSGNIYLLSFLHQQHILFIIAVLWYNFVTFGSFEMLIIAVCNELIDYLQRLNVLLINSSANTTEDILFFLLQRFAFEYFQFDCIRTVMEMFVMRTKKKRHHESHEDTEGDVPRILNGEQRLKTTNSSRLMHMHQMKKTICYQFGSEKMKHQHSEALTNL